MERNLQFMKKSFENLLGDPLCLWGVSFSLLFLFLSAIFLGLFWSRIPPQVPLFFSRPWGEEQLASKNQILLLPSLTLAFFFFNFLSAVKVFDKEPLLSRILVITSTVLVFIFIYGLFRIITLII